ncbi:MAG TPA: hypothetical protein VMS32_09170 [Verrucomicrobiae bacterium]|jgi:hypothetical protein|nr:hypothetical protein [Verrucomicrobiae bacterium]
MNSAPLELFGVRFHAYLAGIAALILVLIAAHGRSTNYNNYVYLAEAFLHGQAWLLHWPGANTVDAIVYGGKPYVIEGPLPAVLMMPLVALFGESANQTLLAAVLCAATVVAAWELIARIVPDRKTTFWLMLFLFAGTDLWWCSMLGDVWFVAHSAAVACTFLALLELTGKRRAWLIAIFAALAVESRFTMVMALPFYAWALYKDVSPAESIAPAQAGAIAMTDKLRAFALTLVPFVVLWAAYNVVRWGTVADLGYTLFYHQDSWGHPSGSPFSIGYFPYQVYSYFLQSPVLAEWRQSAIWPIFKVDPHGVALTFTSPALLLAVLARTPRRIVVALWLTVALVAVPNFIYYLNGWYQFGMRHALDFEPFLLLLMAYAVRDRLPRWGAILCGYSAAVGVWGVWYWDVFFRTGN